MIGAMKPEGETPELAAFTRTMKGLLAVSYDELKARMNAYQRKKKRRKTKRSPSRASSAH